MCHECELCGQMCYCDIDDVERPQPDDCVHLTIAGKCDADKYEDDDYDDD